MSGAEVLIAVDVGTSGARASAFEVAGTPRQEVRRPYPTFLPAEGWAEQDARRWRSAALSALGALVRALGPRCRILAVAVTGQCPSVVPLDRRDRPLRAGLIYRDNRATAEADGMRERFGDRELHELTGHVPAAFHVAAKILWLRHHEPDMFAATRRFVQPTDYVVLALTGQATTDWSMAAATALLDQRARRWAPGLLGDLGLDEAAFPAVVPSWSVAGEIRPKLAARLGLPAGEPVPVVAGAGDSIACALGAGVTAAGPVSEMAGSSSCFNSVVAEPLPDLDVTHYPSITGPRGYVTEVGINTTGEALDWLAQLFYAGAGPGAAPGRLRPHRAGRGGRPAGRGRPGVRARARRRRAGRPGAARRHHRAVPAPRPGRGGPRHHGGNRLRRPGPAGDPGPDLGPGHRAPGVRRRRGHGGLEPGQGGYHRDPGGAGGG